MSFQSFRVTTNYLESSVSLKSKNICVSLKNLDDSEDTNKGWGNIRGTPECWLDRI